MRRTTGLSAALLLVLVARCALGATMSSGFTYPTGSTWSDNGNWLAAGCSEYQCDKYHIGRDISAAQGNKVYAMGSGHIKDVSTTTSDAIQKYMWIEYDLDGGGHFYAVYGHVNTGKQYDDPVSAGDEIATIADYPPYGSNSGDHLHLGIRPEGVQTNGWGRWSLPADWDGNKDNLDRRGFVAPWDYLSSHHPGGWCTAANVWWTSTPSENRWYRSNEHLTYGTSGSSISVATSAMYLADAGLGWHDYWAHAWNGCGDVTVHWSGGWDNQAPDLGWNADTAPGGTWLRGTRYAKWHWSDGLSGIKGGWYAWNGGGHSDGGSGTAQLPEGRNTLQIYVEDNAWNGGGQSGNSSTISAEFWLDNGAPVPSLTGPATSTWLRTPQTVTWDATDATSGIATKTLTWNDGTHANQIPEGKRTATVAATDNAGNSASQAYGPWWIDTSPPVPSVTLVPSAPNGDNGWYTTDPTMTVTATDPNGADGSGVNGVFYTLDGGLEAAFAVPVSVSGDGIHTYSARATDVAGNSGTTGDQIVKVDLTPPVFDAIYTDSESRSLSTLVATWSCSDPDSGIADYEYWIGSQPGWSDIKGVTGTGDKNWAYAVNLNLAAGQCYYLSVRAKNVAGLWSTAVASQAICVHPGDQDASPSFNTGGVSVPQEARTSTNYRIVDSIGQFVVSTSESPSFVMEHGYWHSDISFPLFATPGLTKSVENGKTLQLGLAEKPMVVTSGTSTFADRFYVSIPDRSSGIAAQYGAAGGPALVEGDQVWLIGKINTVNGERMIQFASPTIVGHTDPLAPLFMVVPNLGGGIYNEWTPGVLDGAGLNNIGLLVKTYGGLVSYRDPQGRFFYLDNGDNLYDGSHYGMRIVCDGFVGGAKLAMPAFGNNVIVTGISSVAMVNGQSVRVMRPRRQSDIQVVVVL